MNKDEWESIKKKVENKNRYILCYCISNVKGMRGYAYRLSRRTKLPIRTVRMNLRDALFPSMKDYDAGPEEFLYLLSNVEYIVTNSFNAVAFSIIFNKQFCVFTHGDKKTGSQSRIFDLLGRVGLEDRIFTDSKCFKIEKTEINYGDINRIVSEDVEKSKNVLISAINSND